MKAFSITFLFFLLTCTLFGQSKAEKQVSEAVEKLRIAMITPDKASLENVTSPFLSYGHSSGMVENQQQFMDKLLSGQSDFVTINLNDQTIVVNGKVAIVRHKMLATTNDNNKPGEVKLAIMLVWQRTGKEWKLIGRQAVKS
jgi:hypothetical protein